MGRTSELIVVLVVAALSLLSGFFLRQSYVDARRRIEEQQIGLSRAGGLAAETFVNRNVQVLENVALALPDADRMPPEQIEKRLNSYLHQNPEWAGMGLIASDLHAIAGTQAATRGVDLRDRPYLQELMNTGQPAVSNGLLPSVIQVQSVVVAVPLPMSDGSRGALLASVSVHDLATSLSELVGAKNANQLVIVDGLGQRLVQPASTDQQLESIGAPSYFDLARRGQQGVTEVPSSNGRVLVAYAPAGRWGWIATTTESSSLAFAPAQDLLRHGVILISVASAAVLLAAFAAAWRTDRSYRAVAAARERAERASHALEEFLSIASHELRTPVTAIHGIAQLMSRRQQNGTFTTDDAGPFLDDLLRSSRHLVRLVTDLLDVSRLQGDRLQLHLESLDVVELVERAASEAAPDRVVEIRAPEPLAPLTADPDRLLQVIVNVVGNAAKYSDANTPIRVALERSARSLAITVVDQGIGLAPEDIARIFVPFGRASNAESIPGLGLGLYVSRQLIEAHGGTLLVQSPGLGQGCMFTVTLPLTEPGLGTQRGAISALQPMPPEFVGPENG